MGRSGCIGTSPVFPFLQKGGSGAGWAETPLLTGKKKRPLVICSSFFPIFFLPPFRILLIREGGDEKDWGMRVWDPYLLSGSRLNDIKFDWRSKIGN